MSSMTPMFPIYEPQHFSDYGFDPQIDYFQVMEEARKQKRVSSSSRSIDKLRFKLPKLTTRDDSSKKIKKNKKRWWKNALHFIKRKWTPALDDNNNPCNNDNNKRSSSFGLVGRSISAPVYITESRSGPSTPYRTTTRPSSSPLAGTLTPTRNGDVEVPYISLSVINMDQHYHRQRMSTSAVPIYLVT